jgi:hypothetical protein
MGIASSGRAAPCHARNRGTRASILSSVPLGMGFDTKIAQADTACETQVENSIDQTAFGLKLLGWTIG